MAYNGYYGQESYNYPYTTNYEQPSGFEYPNTYVQTGDNYASEPMVHSASDSSFNSSHSNNSHYPYPSSPVEFYDAQPVSPIRLSSIAVYHTAPVNTSTKGSHKTRTSTSPSSTKSGLLQCLDPGCEYQTKRQYDLDRHQRIHFPSQPGEKFDCPGRGCGRTGEHGFDRKDHLREHLRKVHAKDIPKQNRRSPNSPGK